MRASFRHMTVSASVAAILGTAALATWSPTVSAAANDDGLAEVTVTGSRIQRRDFESNSPIVSVEAADLEERAGLNIESYLNQLPAFNPAASPVTSQGDVQITPVNSVGVATISLRGFGANRNLVLVDGHKPVPTNALMVVDTNGIPSALVERVEIISGGASAVYGADAIGGVTNFILKKNYEGFETDVQFGITEQGDGEEKRAYTVLGTNFADNRGNVTMALEYYDRSKVMQKGRKFYERGWASPYTGGDLFVFGTNAINLTVEPGTPQHNADRATIEALFPDRQTYPASQFRPELGPTRPCTVSNASGTCNNVAFRINEDGSLFSLAGSNLNKYLAGGGIIDGLEYARQYAYDGSFGARGVLGETLKWNNPEEMASGPQSRYSIYAAGNFDVTDSIQFFARGNFNQSKTRTLLLGTNASGGWAAQVPYDSATDSPVDPSLNWRDPAVVTAALAANRAGNLATSIYGNPGFIPTGAPGAMHPVSVEAAILLNSRFFVRDLNGDGVSNQLTERVYDPDGPWQFDTYPLDSFDQRATLNVNTTWQVETGFELDLPIKDWTGEIYYSHGESNAYTNAFGNNSLSRWRALIIQPDWGRNAVMESNQPNTVPIDTISTQLGFGGAIVNCTSGFYDMIFAGDGRPSEDCRQAVIANLQTRTQNQQDVLELNVQGGLFDMWAGEVRGAAGFLYRKNATQFYPDILQSTVSFLDQVIGVYPTGYLDVDMSVKDYYGELLVPLVSDLPFLKRVELELGGRYSTYSATDSTFTYKAVANVQFTDWLRLRGGYNRATRAPNLGELFLNIQEVFGGGGTFGDPCTPFSNSPFGAATAAPDPNPSTTVDANGNSTERPPQLAPGQTPQGAQSTYLICRAQMGTVGAADYYENPARDATQGGGGGGGFAWTLQKGNPNLLSEKADTWTAGLVFTSVSDNPWFSRFTAAIDWWKVDIADAIQQYSVTYAQYLCYGANFVTTEAEAAVVAASEACRNVDRDKTLGGGTTTLRSYDNLATIATSGIDVQLNWAATLADLGWESMPGNIAFSSTIGFLNYYKTKESPLDVDLETDWRGTTGPTLSGTNGGAYKYRLNSSLSYRLNPISVSLRWRFLPKVWGAGHATEKAIIDYNEAVAADGGGLERMRGYTPSTAIQTASYSAFDLSFNWSISDVWSLRAGINNLLDRQPALTGRSTGRPYDESKSPADNEAMLQATCSADALTKGCQNPGNFSLPSPGYGSTSPGYYDTLGRSYFIGVKARL